MNKSGEVSEIFGFFKRGGKTDTLEVHGFHRFVHAFDDARHVTRHLPHRNGRLDPARYCIDAAREAE